MADYMNNKLLFFSLLFFLLFSCKKQIYQFGFFEKKKLLVDEIQFEYFQARTKIKYLEGDQGVNASANIRIKKDSIIWISVTPALGIEMLRAIVTRDSIFIIDRLNKEFEAISLDSIGNRMNFNINYSMLESVLMGNLVLSRNGDDKIIRDGNYFLLKQKNGSLSIDNFVNAKTMKIEKVSIMDDSTRNYMNVDYHNFQNIDSVLFALDNSISLFYSNKNKTFNTQIILTYTKASFSDKKVRFPFNVPNRYESKEN
jgi:hypothetical protein